MKCSVRPVVAGLSELLRRTLDVAQQPEIWLADELQFIRGYLEIMKHRFSDRLTTSFAIEGGLDDALVRRSLQPLVENAIEHGIGLIRGVGALQLRIERCDQAHVLADRGRPRAACGGRDLEQLPAGVVALQHLLTSAACPLSRAGSSWAAIRSFVLRAPSWLVWRGSAFQGCAHSRLVRRDLPA